MRSAPLAATLAFAFAASAAAAEPKVIVIPPKLDRAYDEYHYAPATRVGDTVWVSGIPAGPGNSYEERVERMFQHLEKTLAEAGATLADVVEITSYHAEAKGTEEFRAEFAKFAKIHAKYFVDRYPSWTAVGTTALLAPGAPVEMKAIAVIGSGKQAKVQRAAAAE